VLVSSERPEIADVQIETFLRALRALARKGQRRSAFRLKTVVEAEITNLKYFQAAD
jgi:hypothetical protein